jgi:hypothetical protein
VTEAGIAATLREHAHGCTVAVRLQPSAKKTAITGIYGEGNQAALKVAVQAPPVEGRANEALIAFFSEKLDLPKSSITVLSGELSRNKVLLLSGVTAASVQEQLPSLGA